MTLYDTVGTKSIPSRLFYNTVHNTVFVHPPLATTLHPLCASSVLNVLLVSSQTNTASVSWNLFTVRFLRAFPRLRHASFLAHTGTHRSTHSWSVRWSLLCTLCFLLSRLPSFCCNSCLLPCFLGSFLSFSFSFFSLLPFLLFTLIASSLSPSPFF